MKRDLLKIGIVTALVIAGSNLAKAQTFGDNLGNHKATKDLQMQGKKILNAEGIAIGTATLANGSVALQIDGSDKAILIPRVAANTAIVDALNGMIIYNTTENKFYHYQNSKWVTFALSLQASTDGINTNGDANGYTLTSDGEEIILKLSPATLTTPGVVSTLDQEFGGNKTFGGNVIVKGTTTLEGNTSITGASTLTVGTGATTLGGTLDVADATKLASTLEVTGETTLKGNTSVTGASTLTVGTGATTLGGTLGVAGATTLNGNTEVTGANTLTVGTGKTTLGGELAVAAKAEFADQLSVAKKTTLNADTVAAGVILQSIQKGSGLSNEQFIVVDQDGKVKKSTLSPNSLQKYLVNIPASSSDEFNPEGNSGIKIPLSGLVGVHADDAIVVNFFSGDLADFAGLTILSATATADGEVTVNIADLRNPAETANYAAPTIDGKRLVVTRYSPVAPD